MQKRIAPGAPRRSRPWCGAARTVVLLALACGGNRQTYPRPPDCHVDLLLAPPGDRYVELGEIALDAYAAGPPRYQYRSPYELLAAAHGQICAVGGDALMTERNAMGVIVHATVYRRANDSDIPSPPPAPPTRSESCNGACAPGSMCEQNICIPACAPACGPGQTCGADRQCHAGEAPGPP